MSNVFVFRQPPHGVITEYFGGGKGGSTTTTNNVTQIPPEVLARYNAVNARAETVAQAPYQAYSQDPNAFVAPLTQTQQAGIQNTNAMAGAAQPYYGAATGLAAQSTGSVNPSALNVGQYMNPYTQSVVNATQAALNQQQGQQLSQQQADAIRGGAFGGDRANLQRAQLMGQQSLAQAQAIAPLYQQNYNQALAAAQQQQGVGLGAEQANRQNLQNAAQIFGSIGTNAQQAGLAGAQAQLQAGQQQQQTQQAGLQALYNQFQQQQGFPYQQAQFLANIATGTGALSGNASSGTSTTTGGGGFFSDERLKENIKKVGETNDGQPIYRYNYKGDQRTQIGLLAQDVEKDHPEAVGLAGGYKTVDYKKATEDAIHKEDGGGISGTDAYRIDAPSAMLRENSGKGLGAMPSLPQAFQGGRDIPIETGARNPMTAGLRSPQVTGVTPESRVGAQAELDSLLSAQNQPPGPNGDLLGSGPQYLQSRISTLQDWLNKNASPGPQYSSAGGLVGPEGGAFAHGGSFAHGGLAGGRHGFYGDGYVNPWFEANKGAAQQGVFQLQPMPQRQILQGTPMQAPQQRQQQDPIAAALNIEKLVRAGNEMRPDFLRSAADVAARQRTTDARAAREQRDIDWAKEKGYPLPSDAKADSGGDDLLEGGDDFARGGLIGDRHHYSRGGINPYGGLGGGNSTLGPVLEDQEQQPQPQMMKAPEAPGQKPQQKSGGLGELVDTGLKARSLYKGGEWAAGKLGLGASPTAMSATSAEALPGVIDLTSGAGLAGAGETAAGLAGAGEAAAGLAGAEGLSTMAAPVIEGVTAVATPVMTALEALGPLALLGFSDERMKHDIKKVGTLFDGQPVYRYAYNGDDKTQMGLLAQKVEKAAPEAVGLAGGMKTVNYEKATDKAAKRGHYQTAGLVPPEDAPVIVEEVPLVAEGGNETATTGGDGETVVGRGAPMARPTRPVPKPEDAIAAVPAPRAREPGVASASRPSMPSKSFLPEITSEGVRDTLSSENFWVPAIAGLGAMLASPNKTLAGAIGSGLVGGTTAYTNLEKQQADIMKQRYDLAKGLFRGPTLVGDKWMWEDTQTGEMIPQDEYQRRQSAFITGKSAARPVASAPKPTAGEDTGALGTAKDVIATPQDRPAPRVASQTAETPQTAAPAVVPRPAADTSTPTPQTPAVPAPVAASAAQPLFDSADPLKPPPSALEIQQAALANNALWEAADPSQNPRVLLPRVAKADREIAALQAQADAATAQSIKAGERGPEAAKPFIDRATVLQAQADRIRKQRDDDRAAAQSAIDKATQFDIERAKKITEKQAELQMAPAAARQRLLEEITKLKETAGPLAEAKALETRAVEEEKAKSELVEVMRPDGSTAYVPKAKVLQGDKPVTPGAGAPPGEVTNNTTPDNVKSLPAASLKMREDIGKDELKMSEDYQKRQVAQSRVNGLLDIMTQYETGKFADTKGDIIGKLRGIGINVKDTDTASPAKFEIFMKGAIKNVFDDLPGGKILLAEISGLSRANANSTMQPEANAKILGDALAAAKYEDKYVLDYAKWRQENPNAYSPMDTIRFNEEWLRRNNLDAFKKETARHIGYIGQKMPTNLDEAVHGQRYYMPQTKELRYFDKTFVNPDGSKGRFFKTDPLAGGVAQ